MSCKCQSDHSGAKQEMWTSHRRGITPQNDKGPAQTPTLLKRIASHPFRAFLFNPIDEAHPKRCSAYKEIFMPTRRRALRTARAPVPRPNAGLDARGSVGS